MGDRARSAAGRSKRRNGSARLPHIPARRSAGPGTTASGAGRTTRRAGSSPRPRSVGRQLEAEGEQAEPLGEQRPALRQPAVEALAGKAAGPGLDAVLLVRNGRGARARPPAGSRRSGRSAGRSDCAPRVTVARAVGAVVAQHVVDRAHRRRQPIERRAHRPGVERRRQRDLAAARGGSRGRRRPPR